MIYHPDYRELLELFNAHALEYLVVGGYAVAHHGYSRFTGDLDLWIQATESNATRVLEAMKQGGFPVFGTTIEDIAQHKRFIRMGQEPYGLDILSEIPGVDFATAYATKQVLDADGLPVNFINLKHLVANKKASGRLVDLNDVNNLPDPDNPEK